MIGPFSYGLDGVLYSGYSLHETGESPLTARCHTTLGIIRLASLLLLRLKKVIINGTKD